jgi:hypothetical protein
MIVFQNSGLNADVNRACYRVIVTLKELLNQQHKEHRGGLFPRLFLLTFTYVTSVKNGRLLSRSFNKGQLFSPIQYNNLA